MLNAQPAHRQAGAQCSMLNVQCSMLNVQCKMKGTFFLLLMVFFSFTGFSQEAKKIKITELEKIIS